MVALVVAQAATGVALEALEAVQKVARVMVAREVEALAMAVCSSFRCCINFTRGSQERVLIDSIRKWWRIRQWR